ncbi:glycosyltransferase family 2 protein [Clostridium perfringens]|nr:glycosyltransferase family 2 protein [Clostridium perfringens]
MKDKNDFKISIITVCFNSELNIEETIKSIINQDYGNIEYVIVDGKSNDNTLKIINKYKVKYSIKLLSESDNGIYDAMNKGIDIVTGDYIIFMNSGDKFVDNSVISNFVKLLKDDYYQIYYGNIINTLEGEILNKSKFNNVKLDTFNILRGNSICHQCMFTDKNILKENKFNTKYTICADKDFVIKAAKNKIKFKYIDLDIAFYDRSGVSSNQIDKLNKEAKEIIFKYFPVRARIIYFLKKIKNISINRSIRGE